MNPTDPNPLPCPKCGDACERDEAHNGIAMLYGPWGCACGWSEDARYDLSSGLKLDVHGALDSRGGLTPHKRLPLNCPFCGAGGPHLEMGFVGKSIVVECHGCGIQGPDAIGGNCNTVQDAIDRWNTRAPSAELTQAQAELKEIGERFDGLAKAHEAMVPHQVELRHERDAAVAELADVKPDRDRWEKLAREAAEARLAAQAEAAAMRAALEWLCRHHLDPRIAQQMERHLTTTAGKDLLEQLRQLSAEREHNANEALAMRAERDEARRELAHLEPLISKCAEAMGFIRLAAICLKLNGSQWSEEPGFTVPMNSALLKLCAERDAANALVDRLAGALRDAGTRCEQLHHGKRDQHGSHVHCPVEARIAAALAEVAKSLSPRTTENTKPQ